MNNLLTIIYIDLMRYVHVCHSVLPRIFIQIDPILYTIYGYIVSTYILLELNKVGTKKSHFWVSDIYPDTYKPYNAH